ncbi:MAG: hypothetical protein NXH85_05040 [Pseudomonadaceae bacterium]|nr:hypothetical protein [Pseudomonadaceae bacterium]
MVSKPDKPKRFHRSRARLEQGLADARAVREDPKAVGSIMRRGFVRLWRLRGGGFYGLGWIICFFWLQLQTLRGDVEEAQGVADFASDWLVEKLLTFGFETFMNMGLAFAWPGFLIQWLGGPGIVLLVAGFIVVDRLARPRILALFPELTEQLDAQSQEQELSAAAEPTGVTEPETPAERVLRLPENSTNEQRDGEQSNDERR